ncbi:MAG: PolC-type DNA polymerase III, partial [Acholeplasmataceae bacterium]
TYREGLLVGSGCSHGDVFEAALNRDDETLKEAISFYDYIEVQPPEAYRHLKGKLGEYADEIIEAVITKIVRFAKKAGKIIIASGDVHYLDQKDVLYREIYIRTPLVGGGIHDLYNYDRMPDQYFLTTEEMLERMRFLGDDLAKEITVDNTQLLNRKIEAIKAFPDELYSLPDDAFAETLGIESIADEVRRLVYDKLQYLYGNEPHPYITERVSRELSNIIDNRFAPIYYISHLLVKKSLQDGYLVGSRGSVGSSLVATLLDITEVNPLRPHYRCPNGDFTAFYFSEEEIHKYGVSPEQKALFKELKEAQSGYDLRDADCPICGAKLAKDGHNIPFETFLGFKGDKVPDIDLNFSGEYQAKAHDYVRELLGKDHTFRAGTIQTVAERNAFGYVKGYLEDKKLTFRRAQIERLAKRIQGVRRSTGQHPGGIVVVPKSKTIYDVTPIQYPANDTTSEWKTTHFDYHSFESNLLKLDILGHDDPTMLKYLMDYVKRNPADFPFDRAQDIPIDDPEVYRIFSTVDAFGIDDDADKEIASFGIPEFGTPFTRQMLTATRPDTFAGLVKISGLSHGTDVWLKNAQALIDGTTPYGKIDFNDIIACRDDIMVQLAEFGLEPDRAFEIMEFVRKGKPSKDPVKWLEYEQEMRENGVPDWYIWSAAQIKYMFPKAHATAYVIMAMRIAWFKVYEPLLFYSAFFSKRASHFEYDTMMAGKKAIRKRMEELNQGYGRTAKDENLLVTLSVAYEMVARGYSFLPIDIKRSQATTFRMEENGLRMPFATIDGLGAAVAEDVCNNRRERPFDSLADIKRRTRLNRTLFDKLMDYGAFGDLKSENNVIDDGLFAL